TSIDRVINHAGDVIIQAQSVISDVNTAIDDIDQVLLDAVTFVEGACRSGFLDNVQDIAYLNDVTARFASVKSLVDIIRNSSGLFNVADTLAKDEQQKGRVNTAKRRIREATTELMGHLNTADQAVTSAL